MSSYGAGTRMNISRRSARGVFFSVHCIAENVSRSISVNSSSFFMRNDDRPFEHLVIEGRLDMEDLHVLVAHATDAVHRVRQLDCYPDP